MKKSDIHFEESLFEEHHQQQILEIPITHSVFRGMMFIIIGMIMMIYGRVFFLNVVLGDWYQKRSLHNVYKEIRLPATRGLILDRFNNPLVKNVPALRVSIDVADLLKNQKKASETLAKMRLLFFDNSEVLDILRNIHGEKGGEIIVATNITREQAIALEALNVDFVIISDDFKREYNDSEVFAHVVGYTGLDITGDAIVGKTGLESYYDHLLRGTDGQQIIQRNVVGDELNKKIIRQPQKGYQLTTTIDGDFQRYFYRRFKQGLDDLGLVSGVGLAIQPKTGEVLSLISFPSFDNNNPAKYLDSPNLALFNRAIAGVYSPGSTFKPFVAIAALHEKIVTPTNEFYSPGYIEIPNPYFPDKPSRFLDWKPQGYVNVYSALAKSSNVYFYIVGGGFKETKGLGITKLQEYWKRFDLGEKTGIDLPAEGVGFFYTPEEREKLTGDIWRVGNTYNVSIGQGDLTMTPLRLLSSFNTIANDGVVTKPYIAKESTDERNNYILYNTPQQNKNLTSLYSEIFEVKKGLHDAVKQPYGTAHSLYDLPFPTSGKTGSAQFAHNKKTNAFFIGYGPSDDPEIAILILVENAREGSVNTLPIAHDVLKWYYENRILKT